MAQQVVEARVGTQAVQSRIHPHPCQHGRSLLPCRFEPTEGLVFLLQACVDQNHPISHHITVFGKLMQLFQNLERFISLPRNRVGAGQLRNEERGAAGKFDYAFPLADGLVMHTFALVGMSKNPSQHRETRVKLQSFEAMFDGLVPSAVKPLM